MAFFHAVMDELVHVHPPRDLGSSGLVLEAAKEHVRDEESQPSLG